MAEQAQKGFAVFLCDKYIGRTKPVIVISFNASAVHQWNGQWLVLMDDSLECSTMKPFTLNSDKEHSISEFIPPEMLVDELRARAEGYFNASLFEKHRELWKAFFYVGQPPQFKELTLEQAKSVMVRLAFFSDAVALGFLDQFSKTCGNKELSELITMGRKFKASLS